VPLNRPSGHVYVVEALDPVGRSPGLVIPSRAGFNYIKKHNINTS
jgi:hypothetical protein